MSPNADTKRRFLVVRSLAGIEVHRTEVTGRTENQVEMIENGKLRQMDKENYYLGDEDETGKPWRTR